MKGAAWNIKKAILLMQKAISNNQRLTNKIPEVLNEIDKKIRMYYHHIWNGVDKKRTKAGILMLIKNK